MRLKWSDGTCQASTSGSPAETNRVESTDGVSGESFCYFFSAALCFAHRAFWAAEILARASADIVRFFRSAVAANRESCSRPVRCCSGILADVRGAPVNDFLGVMA